MKVKSAPRRISGSITSTFKTNRCKHSQQIF